MTHDQYKRRKAELEANIRLSRQTIEQCEQELEALHPPFVYADLVEIRQWLYNSTAMPLPIYDKIKRLVDHTAKQQSALLNAKHVLEMGVEPRMMGQWPALEYRPGD